MTRRMSSCLPGNSCGAPTGLSKLRAISEFWFRGQRSIFGLRPTELPLVKVIFGGATALSTSLSRPRSLHKPPEKHLGLSESKRRGQGKIHDAIRYETKKGKKNRR